MTRPVPIKITSPMPSHVSAESLPHCELKPTDRTLVQSGLARCSSLCSVICSLQPRLLVAGPVAAERLERRELLAAGAALEHSLVLMMMVVLVVVAAQHIVFALRKRYSFVLLMVVVVAARHIVLALRKRYESIGHVDARMVDDLSNLAESESLYLDHFEMSVRVREVIPEVD